MVIFFPSDMLHKISKLYIFSSMFYCKSSADSFHQMDGLNLICYRFDQFFLKTFDTIRFRTGSKSNCCLCDRKFGISRQEVSIKRGILWICKIFKNTVVIEHLRWLFLILVFRTGFKYSWKILSRKTVLHFKMVTRWVCYFRFDIYIYEHNLHIIDKNNFKKLP